MASGTVTKYFDIPDSTKEVVYINASDTNTYVTRKFSNIHGATLSVNGGSGTANSVSFSGTVATIHGSLVKHDCTLILRGE